MTIAARVDIPVDTRAAMPVNELRIVLSDGGSTAAAIDLAHRFDARIKALVVEEQAELSDYYDDARAAVRARVMAARDHFERLAAKRDVQFSVVDVAIPPNRSYGELARHCRFSDLVVVEHSATAAVDGSRLMRELSASTIPTMILPGTAAAPLNYDRVAIAWDGQPATARAIFSAIPVLKLARSVTIVATDGAASRSPPQTKELARHLTSHGLDVELATTGRRPTPIEALCNAARQRIEWVAMSGRYSTGLRDLLLGNPVRRMLAGASVPVMLLH